MPEETTGEREALEKGSVQLAPEQWRWLKRRADQSRTYSIAAELRRLVAEAMEREQRELAAQAA